MAGLEKALAADYQLHYPIQQWLEKEPELHDENLLERILSSTEEIYQTKMQLVGAEILHHYERVVMLQILDSHWREHLAALDHLRQYPFTVRAEESETGV